VTQAADPDRVRLRFVAEGAGAVFHVYDRNALTQAPHRFTLAAGTAVDHVWPTDTAIGHDLWILGPNGFHRHFAARASVAPVEASVDDSGVTLLVPATLGDLRMVRREPGNAAPSPAPLKPGRHHWPLDASLGWYDLTLTRASDPRYRFRLAGRHDRAGRATVSDPFRA
jgi:phospholipase C